MDRPTHHFEHGGRCVWCGETRERVADRKAPPFCDERPADTWEDRRRETADTTSGY